MSISDNDNDNDKILFPQLLHDLLDDVEQNNEIDVVSWRPHDRCFKVHKRDDFTSRVLPRYFKQTRYKSFVRQLNIWGFACIGQGPNKGSYFHSSFVRGQRHLCSAMFREKIKGTRSKKNRRKAKILPPIAVLVDPPIADLSESRSEDLELSQQPANLPQPLSHPCLEAQLLSPTLLLDQRIGPLSIQRRRNDTKNPVGARSNDWFATLEENFAPAIIPSQDDKNCSLSNHGLPQMLEPRPIRTIHHVGRGHDENSSMQKKSQGRSGLLSQQLEAMMHYSASSS